MSRHKCVWVFVCMCRIGPVFVCICACDCKVCVCLSNCTSACLIARIRKWFLAHMSGSQTTNLPWIAATQLAGAVLGRFGSPRQYSCRSMPMLWLCFRPEKRPQDCRPQKRAAIRPLRWWHNCPLAQTLKICLLVSSYLGGQVVCRQGPILVLRTNRHPPYVKWRSWRRRIRVAEPSLCKFLISRREFIYINRIIWLIYFTIHLTNAGT